MLSGYLCSGYKCVDVHSPTGIRRGSGIFAAAFIKHFPLIPVEDEVRLQDPKVLKNFMKRISRVKI